ncbi:MAG: lysophospholipase [Spirochaetia bacterium]|nr:lysophospholipase [Spirochaetia bacterium]
MINPGYKNKSGYFKTLDGLKIFYQYWRPDNASTDRAIVLHHGFGEHSDRYGHLLDALEGRGISVYALDARGHGRSEGVRGHAPSIFSYVQDLEQYMMLLKSDFNVRNPILLGHSMGGLIAIAFALHYSNQWGLTALVTSGAALRVAMTPAMKLKRAMGHALASLAPELVMPAGLDASLLSHDAEEVALYKTDPMVHGMVSTSMGISLLDSGEQFIQNAGTLRIPLFMGHGQADAIASPGGTVDFFRNAGSTDKTLRMFPGLYHEIFNEMPRARAAVLAEYIAFIEEHLPEAPPNASSAA